VVWILERDYLFAGKYVLIEELGEGHFSQVWKANQRGIYQDIALKIFCKPPNESQEYYGTDLGSHLHEARHLGRLRDKHNPHIVTVYDVGIDPGTGWNYLVEEFIPGTSLDKTEFRDMDHRLEVVSKLLPGLKFLQEEGIYHNDIKPKNVIIKKDGTPVLIDFGLSVDLKSGKKPHGGPRLYTPPEVYKGQPHTNSDLFSYGVMLYKMASEEIDLPYNQEFPFESDIKEWVGLPPEERNEQIKQIKKRILHEEPAKLIEMHEVLWEIITSILRKDPSERINLDSLENNLELYIERESYTLMKENQERDERISMFFFLGAVGISIYGLKVVYDWLTT